MDLTGGRAPGVSISHLKNHHLLVVIASLLSTFVDCYNCKMDSLPDICFQFECIYKSLRVYRSSIPLKNLFERTFPGDREAASGVSAETWMNSLALGEPHPVFTIFNGFRLMILISIAGKCE